MHSEIDLLNQHIAELEAETMHLKRLVNSKIPHPIQGESSIEGYFRSFKLYITALGNNKFAREQFINGLSAKNKANIPVTRFYSIILSYYVIYESANRSSVKLSLRELS